MSLTSQQTIDTIAQLQENMRRASLSPTLIAEDFNVSPAKIERILHLEQSALEDPWILKVYLEEKLTQQGIVGVPFTALAGDYHQYWFLNSRKIDKMKLSRGDY